MLSHTWWPQIAFLLGGIAIFLFGRWIIAAGWIAGIAVFGYLLLH